MGTKEYYLGLDMGTSSIGWAVTDKNYNLIKAKGKDLWGIHEFDEAQTSVERRTHRISRRRHQREMVRIAILKMLFEDAISKVDPNFYQRLDNSKYVKEDKDEKVRNCNGIFDDDEYNDEKYYSEYRTIFHLRNELINNTEEHDVRLVYLALLNMFKHRGHFLGAELSFNQENGRSNIGEVYKRFVDELSSLTGVYFPKEIEYSRIEDVLSNRNISRSIKAEELAKIFDVDLKNKKNMPYIRAICGLKVNIKLLFEDIEIEKDQKIDIDFSEYDFEEKKLDLLEVLSEEQFNIIELMKQINDIGTLAGIMKGHSYLSEARVAEYQKHKMDLKRLKIVLKKYVSIQEYNKFFREDMEGSYSAYVGSNNSGKKQRRNMKNRKRIDVYNTIKKLLKGHESDTEVRKILEEIENEVFLPKQLTASNGIIPNQLHLLEMKKILSNAETYLPFLKEKDDKGYTVSDKICKLFSFQVPYYIGPTTENSAKSGGNGWVVRKQQGEVLPWNFEEMIDVKATSEKFISRMVRRCTYINGEKVLPKASLEYQSYCVLNEINNLKIDGERIPVKLKQEIYLQLFQKGKKVTRKQLFNEFVKRGLVTEETQIEGIDITINNSLSTYGKFKSILGDEIDTDAGKRMVEDIVFWCTVYGDSKKFLKENLEEKYSGKLSSEQIKRILGFKFKDWGRLSKEFLELQGCNKEDGEIKSLIRMMWDENLNLMELINSDKYTYKQALEDKTKMEFKSLYEIEAEDLDEYYFSAPVKRMVWRTILIIKEVSKILGSSPTRLFIEMTRKEDDNKKRTKSRKQKFIELYKNIKDEDILWKDVIEKADSDGRIRSKKMYLYLTQKGRCMYSGKMISLDDLFNNNLYDIDHIYPRHFVKDDNLDNNLVLVDKRYNSHKSDIYPIEESIYKSQKEYWKILLDSGLINEEKYRRLIGRNPFTDEQKAGFIARQLVETSQGTKGVADILKKILPDTAIVYSKASNVSEFREKREIYKSRLINDFHHAHDAYLNIVVGNAYYVKFTQNPINFIKNEYSKDSKKYEYNLGKMFDRDIERNGEVAWIASKKGESLASINIVKEMLSRNSPMLTRYSFIGHGGLADETLYGAQKAKNASGKGYIPFKEGDSRLKNVERYGGFSSVSTAYFFVVEHDAKNKRIKTIETIPIYMKEKIDKDEQELIRYCRDVLELANPLIKVHKIKIQSLIKINGYFAYLTGRTGNQLLVRNAVNLCLDSKWTKYIKKVEKFNEQGIIDDLISLDNNIQLYEELITKHTEGIYKNRPNPIGTKLIAKRDKFKSLSIEEQCCIILELLRMTSIGGNGADLSLLGESKQSGTMKISKDITKIEELKIINQSITGIYKSPYVDLNKV